MHGRRILGRLLSLPCRAAIRIDYNRTSETVNKYAQQQAGVPTVTPSYQGDYLPGNPFASTQNATSDQLSTT